MKRNIKTHLYCYDDHRIFTEEIRKKFTDSSRYTILSFQTRNDYISYLKKEKENKYCKISIIGMHDTKEQYELIDQLTLETKEIDPKNRLILLCPPDKIEEIKKNLKFSSDAYVPQNANSVLRVHNTVKKLISEHSITIFKKRRNVSLLVMLAFILLSALLFLIAFFRMPKYF